MGGDSKYFHKSKKPLFQEALCRPGDTPILLIHSFLRIAYKLKFVKQNLAWFKNKGKVIMGHGVNSTT